MIEPKNFNKFEDVGYTVFSKTINFVYHNHTPDELDSLYVLIKGVFVRKDVYNVTRYKVKNNVNRKIKDFVIDETRRNLRHD